MQLKALCDVTKGTKASARLTMTPRCFTPPRLRWCSTSIVFLCSQICVSSDKARVLVGGYQQRAKYSAIFGEGSLVFIS